MRDRAWFARLYGEIIPEFSEGIIDRTGEQTMLYLTCTMISSVGLACYGVSRAKVDCGTRDVIQYICTVPIYSWRRLTCLFDPYLNILVGSVDFTNRDA